ISFLNWAEPVMLVRSPMLTKREVAMSGLGSASSWNAVAMSTRHRERLEPGEASLARRLGHAARGQPVHRRSDRGNMRGRRTAAAAEDVGAAEFRPFAQQAGGGLGLLVVVAELGGQAGGGISD